MDNNGLVEEVIETTPKTELNPIALPKKGKTTVTGTSKDDFIDMSLYAVPTKGSKKGKGLTIKGGKGNDTIIGTSGKDTITGGAGTNTIMLSTKENFGADTVVLTKGENLKLQLDVNEDTGVYVEYGLSGKNLVIKVYEGISETDEESDDDKATTLVRGELKGSVTIKNYTKKDVITAAGSLGIYDSDGELITDLRSVEFLTKLTNAYKKTSVSGTWVNDRIDASEYQLYSDKKRTVENNNSAKKGLTISSGAGNDYIVGSKYSDVIKGGSGNDVIIGGAGNDTITGGTGRNTLIFEGSFGNDTVNLTNNEQLTLDLSAFEFTDPKELKYQIIKNDLKIIVPNSDGTNAGTILLKNFAKTNTVGSNGGYVKMLLSDGNLVDMNNDVFLEFKNGDFTSTGTFVGSRLSETIDARGLTRGAVISAGAGQNVIYSTNGYTDKITAGNNGNDITIYNGNKTVTTGSGNDTFHISGTGAKTIKAGAGVNTFEINNKNGSAFGNITIAEEKVKAQNKVVFDSIYSLSYTKNGNDLIVNDGTSSLTLADYYSTNIKKAAYTINDKTIPELFNSISDFKMNVTGKGKIVGTGYSDIIRANDVASGVTASSDTITAGVGNDIINAGRGKNSLYFYEGDGEDIVENGGGTDTLIFAKNTKVDVSLSGSKLTISYGTKGDTITVYNYSSEHSVKNIKIGTKTATVASYLPKDTTPTVVPSTYKSHTTPPEGSTPDAAKNGIINGTNGDDIIIGTSGNDNINGKAGDDMLYGGAGDDTITGGAGDDIIFGGTGNDIILGGKGKNIILFDLGDGSDLITEYGTDNTLHFYNVSNINKLKLVIVDNTDLGGKDLVISGYGTIKDKVTIQGIEGLTPYSNSTYLKTFSDFKISIGEDYTKPDKVVKLYDIMLADDFLKDYVIESYKPDTNEINSYVAAFNNQSSDMVAYVESANNVDPAEMLSTAYNPNTFIADKV